MASFSAPFVPTAYRFIDPVGGSDAADGTTIANAWLTFAYALDAARGMGGGYVLVVKNGTTDTEGAIANGTFGTSTSSFAITGMPRPEKSGMSALFTPGSVVVSGVLGLTLTVANSETRTFSYNNKTYTIGKWTSSTSFELVLPWDQTGGTLGFTLDADMWYNQFVTDGKYDAGWAADDLCVLSHGSSVSGLVVRNFTVVSNLSYLNTDAVYGYACFAVTGTLGVQFISVSARCTASYAAGLVGPYTGASYRHNLIILNCSAHMTVTPASYAYIAAVSIGYGSYGTVVDNCCFTGYYSIIDSTASSTYGCGLISVLKSRLNPATSPSTRYYLSVTNTSSIYIDSHTVTTGTIIYTTPSTFVGINATETFVVVGTTKYWQAIGKMVNQTVGDANFTLNGLASIQVLTSNVAVGNIGYRNKNTSSLGTAYSERSQPMPITMPAGTHKIRRNVNHQLSTLTKDQLWLEITDSVGNLVRSNNSALTTQASASDWTQWITSDSFTLNSPQWIYVNTYFSFYHATQMVALGAMQWSNDNGATWNDFEMLGVYKAEPQWIYKTPTGSLPALTLQTGDTCFLGMPVMIDMGMFPTIDKVLRPTIYGENGQFTGTAAPSTVTSVSIIGPNITVTGNDFGNVQPSGYIHQNGVRYVITSWSNTLITGTEG